MTNKFIQFLKFHWPLWLVSGLMLVYFWPSFVGGTFIASGMTFNDLMLFNYPLKDWYRELLLKGQLPLWTNLVGNGYPVFAESQIGALYPPHLLLFHFLPTLLAFNLNVFLHFVLAVVFTYMFCQTVQISNVGSALAGLAYSFSGFLIAHLSQINIVMTNAYLPLDFLMIYLLAKRARLKDAFGFSLILALQFYVGHAEMFYYNMLLSGLFLLLLAFLGLAKNNLKKAVFLFAAAGVLAGGIGMIQILPTLELAKFSQRSEGVTFENAASTLWPLNTLILFLNPRAYDIYRPDTMVQITSTRSTIIFALYGYLGLIPLFLAFWAIGRSFKEQNRLIFVFAILLILAFLWGIGRSTQFFALFWQVIPGMKFFRYPTKILFFIEFCLAILAAFGFDSLKKFLAEKKVNLGKLGRFGGLGVLLIVFADLYFNNALYNQPIINGGEWFKPTKTVEFLQNKLKEGYFRVYSHGSNNLDYQLVRDVRAQKEFQRLLFMDFNMIYRIPENREWFVLLLERQTKLNQMNTKLDLEKAELTLPAEVKKSLSLQGVKYLLSDLPIKDPDLVEVFKDPFSRTVDHYAYIVTPEGVQAKTVPASAVYIYENEKVLPQVTLVGKYQIANGDAVLAKVLSEGFDPREEVLLEEEPARPVSTGSRAEAGQVEIAKYEEMLVEIKTKNDQPAFLVLADTYYPGWHAYIDDQETKIYRANYAFRAIEVPAGEHQVVFKFTPTNFKLGAMVSLGSLILVIMGLAITSVVRRSGKE